MKVYNKKGLIVGIVLCVMGTFSLIKDFIMPADLMILQVKHIIISFLLVSVGLNYIIRALSQKNTEEDIAETKDIRNHIIKSKIQAKTFIILQIIIFIGVILSLIAFYFTENILIVAIFITLGLLLSISWIIELIAMIYYEIKQQGDEFK